MPVSDDAAARKSIAPLGRSLCELGLEGGQS